jgi:uncharacterized ferredoxin-like protein
MEGVEIVAELMKVAAITAPKAAGQDYLEVKVVTEKEMVSIEEEMHRLGEERNIPNFGRDADNVKQSGGLLLIGVKRHPGIGLDCTSCGFGSCREFNDAPRSEGEFEGPNCMLRLLDLGIALGSAAKTAQMHNVDNRIMYRVGVAARNLGLMPESSVVMGIPLSATGKSIYFDR